MDKLSERKTEEKKESFTKAKGLSAMLAKIKNEKYDRGALLTDLVLFATAFILSRCHLLFGAYPLGIAFLAVLPFGVLPALIGAIIGSLTMGVSGLVFVAGAVFTVFIRAMISGAEKIFSETLLLRTSSAVLGGFVASVVEILFSGFSERTMLLGIAMIALPPTVTFIFSGLFNSHIGMRELFLSDGAIFSGVKEDHEKHDLIFFQISALVFLFFISLSLGEVVLFGISLSYIFTTLVTLLVAKRFGAMRAMAVGFITSLGVSGAYSVSFALAGLCAGVLFSFGTGFAIVGGGAALSAWSIYYSGLGGFLTTIPEYIIASVLSLPILKAICIQKSAPTDSTDEKSADDMVGTMALSYQNKYSGCLDTLETSLSSLSGVIRGYCTRRGNLSTDEYRDIVIEIADKHCKECSGLKLCMAEGIHPCVTNADKISEKLRTSRVINAEDVNTELEFCQKAGAVADAINRAAREAEAEYAKLHDTYSTADEYELFSQLITSARGRDDSERAVDAAMSKTLAAVFEECGFDGGTIRAFGERRRHFILAGEDEDGSKITSPQLRGGIESAVGLKLATPEYFRRGKMALMECGIRRGYKVSVATATLAGDDKEISGDTISTFESDDDYFYSLVSDGMGKGEVAKETSEFVSKFLSKALGFGASKETVIHMLNGIIRKHGEECSATVDLFELDLLTGEATFIKSGAAPSYVKRDSSIFRIRSQTAPIGLLRTIDTEKIRVEVRSGDYIIMLSDGIAEASDDAPWLLELLAEAPKRTLKEYADTILREAAKMADSTDDKSVVVMKIETL